MDIKSKLTHAIKDMEDLKKVLSQAEAQIRDWTQRKQQIIEQGLQHQGRLNTLQEIHDEHEKEQAVPAETPAAETPAESTPLDVVK